MLGMIVACDRNGAIGKDGDLPWRQSTACNTSNVSQWIQPSSWGGRLGIHCRVLPGRRHVVLSRGEVEGVEVISFDQVMDMEGWIIGGGQIYELFLPHVSQLHRTIIDTRVDGADTYFPDITGMGFELSEERHVLAGEKDQHDMIFQHWIEANPIIHRLTGHPSGS